MKEKKRFVSKNFLFPSYTESIINTLCPNNQIISHSFLGEAYPYSLYPTMLLWNFIRHTHIFTLININWKFYFCFGTESTFCTQRTPWSRSRRRRPRDRPPSASACSSAPRLLRAGRRPPSTSWSRCWVPRRSVGGQEEVRRRSSVQEALTWRRRCRRSRSRWPPWPRRCRPASRCCC